MTDYEAAILDVDGTIVRGGALIPGADQGVRALERAGCDRLLVSNNPTTGTDHYGDRLEPHGIDVDPTRILTSATLSASYLADTHPDETVYLVGSDALESILTTAGITVTTDPDEAEVVLGSFDKSFSFGMLWESLQALENGTPFYGTDPDVTIPVDGGSMPGSGSILAAMEAVAGREPDAILGKPSAVAAETALERLESDPRRTLVVGDRLDTDIALGNRAGMTTAAVLTGVTDRAAVEEATGDLTPDHVLESLGDVGSLL
ncbi:HAD-IIA family hydrolase [Natrialba sp. SSL1]|uniref:HAD-IIA family hydrolase n=1 Tax=Natrialba sp. SSL1 TaxID=1869245 RepID=UPI0008F80B21|nr:HAD-IIA family hydrolase [Natrialba sp. SSL1]OIB57911.1 HAD family hydrolase [Natrialba sp. SSL1]